MTECLPILMKEAIQIAWNYLERTGELGDPEVANTFLIYTVNRMLCNGESRKLMLANRAVDAYRRSRVQLTLEATLTS
jgi:hypothetical protein